MRIDFVKAVEATGRKTLVIAGVWTSVCVAFPALQAKADGYKVYFVMDASGDPVKAVGDSFVVQGEPRLDAERLIWTVDLRPA